MSLVAENKTVTKSVAVPSVDFELVARIVEGDVTEDPRFISAPLVLEALRRTPDRVHVRLVPLHRHGCTWVYEPMPDAEWLVVIDPEVWASARSAGEL